MTLERSMLERSTYIISASSAAMGVLNLAAALINARAGNAIAAILSATTAVICVWILLFAQRRAWLARIRAMEEIAVKSHACAERALSSALVCKKEFDAIRPRIEQLLDQSGTPKEVIHDGA